MNNVIIHQRGFFLFIFYTFYICYMIIELAFIDCVFVDGD